MQDGIMNLGIGELFSRLHRALTELVEDAARMVELNSTVTSETVRSIRDRIIKRLSGEDSIEEDEAVLKILDLFVTDRAFIRMVNEDSKDWLEFLEAIEKSLKRAERGMDPRDRLRIERITVAIDKAKLVIRR